MRDAAPDTALTARQLEVVHLVALGCTNEEAAARLGISARTVKAHCDVLRHKLRVDRRREIPQAYYAATGINPWPSRRVSP